MIHNSVSGKIQYNYQVLTSVAKCLWSF